MAFVAVLHPGEMGTGVGAALVRNGHDVGWLPIGRSKATQARAATAALRELDGLVDVEVVISVCPPAAALHVARSVVGFRGVFVDANAISPDTAASVAQAVTTAGATYVDGALIGSPPSETRAVHLALSGEAADKIAGLFTGTTVRTSVLPTGPYAASTLKMTFAAWTKISRALLLAVDDAARELGVAQALHAEWAESLPGLAAQLDDAQRAAEKKAWRWEAEMREIAKTFTAAGQPSAFGVAAAAVFAKYARRDC